jgi:hypothetical protein
MSNASGFDPVNPYSAPRDPAALSPWGAPSAPSSLPTFVKVVAIMDLVLCVIRLLLALLGIAGYMVLKQQNSPMAGAAVAEIATGFGISFFGIPAASLILIRKPWAAALLAICVLFTLASIGVGLWQVTIQLSLQGAQFPPGSPQRIGFFIGAGGVTVFRLAVLALYVAAVCQFVIWSRRQPKNAPMC